MNYYDILGVTQSATEEEIKKAFKSLMKAYHPDNNSGNKEAEEKCKKITEAYETLSDSLKRREYDEKNLRKKKTSTPAQSNEKTGFDVCVYEAKERNKEAYDKLLKILEQAERELKPFYRNFKSFREKIKEKRGILTEEQIEIYIRQILKTVKIMKENGIEFDKYMKVVEQYEEELKPFNENLSSYKKSIALKKGILTWQEIEFNEKPKLMQYVKKVKCFSDFMQFLEKVEIEANQYGKSLVPFKKTVMKKKKDLTYEQIEKIKANLIQEFSILKENCSAFDNWMKQIEAYETELAIYGEDLQEYKEQLNRKRGELTPQQIIFTEMPQIENYVQKIKVFADFMQFIDQSEKEVNNFGKSLQEYKKDLEMQKEKLSWQDIVELRTKLEMEIKNLKLKNLKPPETLLDLKREFIRRGIDWNLYLKEQNLKEKEIDKTQINTIFDSLMMLDELQKLLNLTIKISLEKLLEELEKNKLQMENEQLHLLYEKLQNFFENNSEYSENSVYFFQNFPFDECFANAKRA